MIAETQLATFSIDEQKLVRLSADHRAYLEKFIR